MLNLRFVCPYTSRYGVCVNLQINVFRQEPAQHASKVTEQFVEVKNAEMQHLLTAEREQLLSQTLRAVRRFHDGQNKLPLFVANGRVARQQICESDDRRQQVVKVVGDAGREFPNRVHALQRSDLFFEYSSLPFGVTQGRDI